MFRRTLGFGVLLLAVVILVPAEVHAQKKKKGKNDSAPPASAQDYAQLSQLKEVTGKLVFAELSAQSLSLRLDYQHVEANPNYKPNKSNNNVYQQMQRVMNDQAALARTKNAVQQQQKMRQLAQDMQRLQQQLAGTGKANPNSLPYKIVTDSKDFELPVDDKVVVRRQNLAFMYDDKGEVVKYSKEEIEKLRGKDKSKPGYEAKFEDLTAGQTVKLYLKAPATKTASTKDPKTGDEDLATPNDRKPRVTMILIVQDSNEALNNQQQQKKNKK